MKRLLFFLTGIIISAISIAQNTNYQKVSTPYQYRHLRADSVLAAPYGTEAVLRQVGDESRPGALFCVINGTDTLMKFWTGSRWIDIGGTRTQTGQNEVLYGGSVTPLGGSVFFVQDAIYRIDNVVYQSDTLTIVIDDADVSLNRIDRIYLATDNEAHVIKGEPDVNALEPQLDADQIGLAFISIPAGSEPSVISTIIYDENTESSVTNTGTTTDPDNATNVYSGSKSLNVTNINDPTGSPPDEVLFTKTSGTWNVIGFDGLSMFILLKSAMPASANLRVQLFVGSVAVSSEVTIGLNKSNTTTYQPVTIQAASFGTITNTSITRVRIRYVRGSNNANYTGFYLDNMFFVFGVVQSPPSVVSMTLTPPVGFRVPTNTIQNGGAWTITADPGSYGSLDNFYSPDGWQSLPQILSAIGTLDGRAKTANGAEVDEEEIFLQTVDATYPGLATPDMYDKIYNQIYQQYYISNVGDGDTLAIPINDTVTGIKSLKEGTNITFDITDSTITINAIGASYTDEQAQDAAALLFTPDNGDIDYTYNDGTPDIAATIKNDAVSYAKIQNVSAASKLLGRGDSGSGDVQEITLGTGLTMTGTTLSASGGNSKFGVSGEDDAAAENRQFIAGVYQFGIFGGDGVTTLQYLDFWDVQNMKIGSDFVGSEGTGAHFNFSGGMILVNNLSHSGVGASFKYLAIDTASDTNRLYKVDAPTGGSYTDEQAQDAIGAMINASLQYVDGTPLLAIGDRDFGDITTSGSGLTMTIDNLAVTNAKINDVAWSKVTGTPTTLSGYGITDALSNSTTSTQDGYFGTIKLRDVTNPSHYLTVRNNEDLTAAHTLNIITGDADRTLTLTGNATISGTNTGDQTSVTGNAGTATALQTPRNIQGVAFDGTANIDIINGTGFVKATGTTISYDNSTYVTSNIYSADGTLAGNRAVALNSLTLNFNQGLNPFLTLDPTAGAENALLQAYNTTANDNVAYFQAQASNTNSIFAIQADFNAGVETTSIEALADATTSTLTYTANTHQFTGNVGIGVTPTGLFQVQSGGIDLLTIDPTAGNELSQLLAYNVTGAGSFSLLEVSTTNTSTLTRFQGSFNGGAKSAKIDMVTNSTDATIEYEADTHTFTGTIQPLSDNSIDIGTSSASIKDIYSRTLKLDGSTSGTATITAPAVAGTPTLTLPSTTGTLALTSDISITKGFMTDLMTANGITTIIPRYIWTDEFQGAASNAMGGVFTLELVSGTGANASSVANASSITGASGFGYAEINTGTTTTGKAVLHGGHGATNNNQMGSVNNDIYYRVSFKNVIFNDLSDGTETYKTWMGFGVDNANTNGIWFTYTHSENSGAFNCHSYNNTTVETTSTATTVAADTEYDLDIEYYNQTAKFYINGTLVATHTTQVPAAASVMQAPIFKILKSAGTTARIVYLDAMTLRITHENDL